MMASSMRRSRPAIALAVVASLLVGLVPASVLAQPAPPPPPPATEATKAEARDRFDRGLKLFNDGENAGALAEFKRAYELIPNTLVLYNIGLVSAAMGRPVEAVDALDRALADAGALSAERIARARQTRDEQAARIAQVAVTTQVPATIEVDGVETAKTPLSAPMRVSGGLHVFGAFATGYAPVRKEVTVASGERIDLPLEL